MFKFKKGHQPGVYVPLRALFLVGFRVILHVPSRQRTTKALIILTAQICRLI